MSRQTVASDLALRVECPICKAWPGLWCMWVKGGKGSPNRAGDRKPDLHPQRIDVAETAAGGTPLRFRKVRDYQCLTCGAQPGQPCIYIQDGKVSDARLGQAKSQPCPARRESARKDWSALQALIRRSEQAKPRAKPKTVQDAMRQFDQQERNALRAWLRHNGHILTGEDW